MKVIIALLFTAIFVVSCGGPNYKIEDPGVGADMHKVAAMINQLLPFVYDSKKFEDKSNAAEIQSRMRLLKKYIHNLPSEKLEKMVGPDPIVNYAIQNMESDLDGAIESYSAGHFKYSRGSLKSTVSGCFQCHTRTNVGTKHMAWGLNFKELSLSPLEKADLYIATRQFDKAINELEGVFFKKNVTYMQEPFLKEQSLKKMLTTIVRVEQDPALALKKLERIENKKSTPNYLANSIQYWRQSLKRWLLEKSNSKRYPWSFGKYFDKAKSLAGDAGQDAAFVDYLRISSELHDRLGLAKGESKRAQIYLQLGQTYEAMKDSGFWDVPRVYFEACIVTYPKTKTAKSCYLLLKEEVTLGFTGSAGTIVPEGERVRLEKYKKMAGY